MKLSEPNRHDLIPAAVIVLLTVLALVCGRRLLAGGGGALTAEISVNGRREGAYVLSSLPASGKTLTLTGSGVTLEVLLERDGVSVLGSDCPGHDCVKTGKITAAGRSIVCLPGRIVITLRGAANDTGIDIYAG